MYRIEVKTKNGWRYLKPTGGSPYTYGRRYDAVDVAKMCYPEAWRERRLGGKCTVRVVKVHESREPTDVADGGNHDN